MMVSVIIPVYNAQRTIRRCLNSVLNQTWQDVEIVVVNDGSKDRSKEMIDEILSNVGKKVVIHKEKNEGVEKARQTGIDSSHGDCITFLDSDDYIIPETIEKMVNALIDYNVDIVQCQTKSFITIHRVQIPLTFRKRTNSAVKVIEKQDIMEKEYLSFFGCGNFSVNVWSKLYKRELLDNLKMGDLRYGQDLYLSMQVFPRVNRICVVQDFLYNYEKQGTTSKCMPLRMEVSKQLYRYKIEAAKEMHSEKAILYSTIELRNCFKSQVESMILHKVDTEQGIKQWIAHELTDSTYDVFEWLMQQDAGGKSPMSLAIMTKDVDTIYEQAKKSVYEWNWKKIGRRLLS